MDRVCAQRNQGWFLRLKRVETQGPRGVQLALSDGFEGRVRYRYYLMKWSAERVIEEENMHTNCSYAT